MINREHFFATVRASLFGGRLMPAQVSGMEHLLDVWEGCYAEKHPDIRFLAYCLATTFHETNETMQPIEEIGNGKGHSYGHPAGPWHQVYDGRGDVQLTWERNYAHAEERLKAELGITVELHHHPDRAMDPDIAGHILFLGSIEGWFTGKRLFDYFAGRKEDPLHARRIINRLDRAAKIAGHYHAFLPALTPAAEAKSAA